MVDYLAIYSVIMTVSTASFAYFWYRRNEIVKLAENVYDAAKDKCVTEEEFQKIADNLGDILYKK